MAERRQFAVREGLVDPASPSSEAFRTLRLALQLRSQSEETTAILVTSAEPKAGKSTTAANYANLSAFGGARVLLVDADVRNPAQHAMFGLSRSPGLVEYVASRAPLEQLVQSASPQLDLLTAGQQVPRASDVSHSHRIADMLREASSTYDVIIIDAPPVLAAADAEALASHAGVQVVFVADGSASRRRNILKALRRFELIHARVAGIVLNRSGDPLIYYGS